MMKPAEVGVTGSWCILAMILAPVKYLPYGTATRRETEGEGDVFLTYLKSLLENRDVVQRLRKGRERWVHMRSFFFKRKCL